MEGRLQVYRLNAVGKEGKVIVLGVCDTASSALAKLKDAFAEYPRAWVTDQSNLDVSFTDLVKLAEEEQRTA